MVWLYPLDARPAIQSIEKDAGDWRRANQQNLNRPPFQNIGQIRNRHIADAVFYRHRASLYRQNKFDRLALRDEAGANKCDPVVESLGEKGDGTVAYDSFSLSATEAVKDTQAITGSAFVLIPETDKTRGKLGTRDNREIQLDAAICEAIRYSHLASVVANHFGFKTDPDHPDVLAVINQLKVNVDLDSLKKVLSDEQNVWVRNVLAYHGVNLGD